MRGEIILWVVGAVAVIAYCNDHCIVGRIAEKMRQSFKRHAFNLRGALEVGIVRDGVRFLRHALEVLVADVARGAGWEACKFAAYLKVTRR